MAKVSPSAIQKTRFDYADLLFDLTSLEPDEGMREFVHAEIWQAHLQTKAQTIQAIEQMLVAFDAVLKHLDVTELPTVTALRQKAQDAVASLQDEATRRGRLSPEEIKYELRFQRLGRTVGEDASPKVQRELERWWADQGREGAAWLVGRIRDEFHADLLLSVAQCLIFTGAPALEPVVKGLRGASREVTRALLIALTELPLETMPGAVRAELQEALDRLESDPDPDVRELAGEVVGRLPSPAHASLPQT